MAVLKLDLNEAPNAAHQQFLVVIKHAEGSQVLDLLQIGILKM